MRPTHGAAGARLARPTGLATALAFSLIAVGFSLHASASPTVSEAPDRVTVANSHFAVTFDPARGGAISEVVLADGTQLCGSHNLYSDWGIFSERTYNGSANCPATVTARREEDSVVVRAEGRFHDSQGKVSSAPGAIAYSFEVTVSDAPDIRVEWTATPDFSKALGGAFFSYILSVQGCIGSFANAEAGVLLRDAAVESTRTIQSAEDPLHAKAPWLGLMRTDGSILAFTDIQGTPPLENVFFHEDGKGNAGIFFAWLCGGARQTLEPGKEWRGGFTMRLAPSFEEFRLRFQ